MAKNLVIVESPAKANTIKKYLGKDFEVKSSYGHIRDLSKKKLGVDVEHNFKPNYIIDSDKKKIVKELKEAVKKSEKVWLASDEDREGEAIAWHLAEVLGLKQENSRRIVFHEITKDAILNAIKNPRWINYDLVNAQQARRILDRLVGFELSELLWKKVRGAMSAGRVQSVAVKLIVDREEEIKKYKPEKYYRVTFVFEFESETGELAELKAELSSKIKTEKQVLDLLKNVADSEFSVADIKVKEIIRKPLPPFTTSTLQQEASRKLGYSVARTMMLAQRLYEAGKITYMRTDSVHLSKDAQEKSKSFIVNNFGEKYLKTRQYKTKSKGAQEAHEAIRPTEMKLKVSDDSAEQRLYELIFFRTIASQMSEAVFDRTTIVIKGSKCKKNITASAEMIKFDGFLRIYNFKDLEEDEQKEQIIPQVGVGQTLKLKCAKAAERHSNPPARYNEASLVKKLEELGIGRPSTYAPIITTIQKRSYIIKTNIEGEPVKMKVFDLKDGQINTTEHIENYGKERNKFKPTDIGMLVTAFLSEHFPNIVDYNFTATVEKDFDLIAQGKEEWTKVIANFYEEFHKAIKEKVDTAEKVTGERLLGQDPQSGKNVYVKIAKYGPVVQLGDTESKEKPQFAKLPSKYSIETISLEKALEIFYEGRNGKFLGNDPKTGLPVYARFGKYGPIVQIGTYDDKENLKFANLLKNQKIETITLQEALKLFELPRDLGEYEGKKVVVGIGRFGPYVRHNGLFVSLKKTDNPLEIDLDRAIELIEAKREQDRKRLIKEFDKDFKIIKDRWGKPTIYYKKKYYRLAKDIDPQKLTAEDCLKIIETSK